MGKLNRLRNIQRYGRSHQPDFNPHFDGPRYIQHRYSTASFKMSHRKLNLLSRQIAGKPIDAAILQMVFSDKRAATRVKSMLCVARDHAESYKGLRRDKLVVGMFPSASFLLPSPHLANTLQSKQPKVGSRKARNYVESISKVEVDPESSIIRKLDCMSF
jgi:hypothetical protein